MRRNRKRGPINSRLEADALETRFRPAFGLAHVALNHFRALVARVPADAIARYVLRCGGSGVASAQTVAAKRAHDLTGLVFAFASRLHQLAHPRLDDTRDAVIGETLLNRFLLTRSMGKVRQCVD